MKEKEMKENEEADSKSGASWRAHHASLFSRQ
jgi:hypothetical protein